LTPQRRQLRPVANHGQAHALAPLGQHAQGIDQYVHALVADQSTHEHQLARALDALVRLGLCDVVDALLVLGLLPSNQEDPFVLLVLHAANRGSHSARMINRIHRATTCWR
jgi:hypothetical protein